MRTEILLLGSLLYPDLPPSKASSTLGAAETLWRPWRREGTHLQTRVLQEVRGKSPFILAGGGDRAGLKQWKLLKPGTMVRQVATPSGLCYFLATL